MRHLKTITVPLIEVVLSMIKKGADKYINKISGSPRLKIQKIALCDTAPLIRRILSMRLKIIIHQQKKKKKKKKMKKKKKNKYIKSLSSYTVDLE